MWAKSSEKATKSKISMRICWANYKNKNLILFDVSIICLCGSSWAKWANREAKVYYDIFFVFVLSFLLGLNIVCILVCQANYPQWWWHAWIVFICFYSMIFFPAAATIVFLGCAYFSSVFLNVMCSLFAIFWMRVAHGTILLGIRKNGVVNENAP